MGTDEKWSGSRRVVLRVARSGAGLYPRADCADAGIAVKEPVSAIAKWKRVRLALQYGHRFLMISLRKQVHHVQTIQTVAGFYQRFHIAR